MKPSKAKGLDMVVMPSPVAPNTMAVNKKMIEVTVRFWTNNLGDKKGRLNPKHARTSGMVTIGSHPLHGIRPIDNVPFHSIFQIPAAIEKALKRAGAILHPSAPMRRYMDWSGK